MTHPRIGVDVVFNWDHFFPLYGDRAGPHFEFRTILAAGPEALCRWRDRRAR